MDKILSFLGLLNRGGKTLIGPSLEKGMRKVNFLFIANDSKRKEEFLIQVSHHNIPYDSHYGKGELGESLGYDELSAVGIIDAKAAKAMKEKIKER